MFDPMGYSSPSEPTIPDRPYINPYETTSQQYEIPPPPPPKEKRSILTIVLVVTMCLLVVAVSIFALALYKTNRYISITTEIPTEHPTIVIPTATPVRVPTNTPTTSPLSPYTAQDIYDDFMRAGIQMVNTSPYNAWHCCDYTPEGGSLGWIDQTSGDYIILAVFASYEEASIDAEQVVQHEYMPTGTTVYGHCLLIHGAASGQNELQPYENVMMKYCT